MEPLITQINQAGYTVSLHQFQGLGGRWHAEAHRRSGKIAPGIPAFGDTAQAALASLLAKLAAAPEPVSVDPFAFENEEDPLA